MYLSIEQLLKLERALVVLGAEDLNKVLTKRFESGL